MLTKYNKIIEYGISNVEFETTEEGERRGSFVFNGGQIVKIEVTSKEAHERYINRVLYNAKKDLIEKLVSDMRKDSRTIDRDFILDGSIRLVRVEALEDFWRRRGAA